MFHLRSLNPVLLAVAKAKAAFRESPSVDDDGFGSRVLVLLLVTRTYERIGAFLSL